MAIEKKPIAPSIEKAALAKFLDDLADKSYRPVEIEVSVPDGPMSSDEVDALLEGLREVAKQSNDRVRFWRRVAELGGKLGRTASAGF